MSKPKKFPEVVFVAWMGLDRPDEFLSCDSDPHAVIEDDGPTRVASYKLVEINELSKRIASKPSK